MSTLTVSLPEEDLSFLRAHAEAHGISPEAFLALQTRNLRRRLQAPLHPNVIAASGIIAPEIDAEEAYRKHIEEKYA